MKQPQQITDLVNEARDAFIEFVQSMDQASAKKYMNLISRIANELDITEQKALEMVKGYER
jgi:hypothetical protein